MNSLLHYIVETSIILAVFLLLFNLLLKREKSFHYNRFFLLVAPILALILPLLDLPFLSGMESNESLSFVYELPILVTGVTTFMEPEIQEKTIPAWIFIIYAGGVLFYCTRYVIQLIEIYLIIKSAKNTMQAGEYVLVISNTPQPTFSFLNYIIVGSDKSIEEGPFVHALEHERVHIRQKHTFDVLFIEMLSIVLWFNPVIHYFKVSIRENHEFLADQSASSGSPLDYSLALLKELKKGAKNSIPSYFSMNLTKRRLHMITSKKRLSASLKPAASLPFLLIVFIAFSCKNELLEKHSLPVAQVEADFYSQTPGDFEKIMSELERRYPGKLFRFTIVKDIDLEIIKANSNGYDVEYYHQLTDTRGESFEYKGREYKLSSLKDGVGVIYSWPDRNKHFIGKPYKFDERVYRKSEVSNPPEPWLGESHLLKRLISHTNYPDIKGSENISGTVWVKFTVNQLENIIYSKPVSNTLDTNDPHLIERFSGMALVAIKSLDGYYKPGILNGNKVNVEMELPVHFNPDKN